jgi:hypothetical protein
MGTTVNETSAARQPTITRDRLTALRATLERPAAAAPSTVARAVQPPIHDGAPGKETAAASAIQNRLFDRIDKVAR